VHCSHNAPLDNFLQDHKLQLGTATSRKERCIEVGIVYLNILA
jgi:hypothetical protein